MTHVIEQKYDVISPFQSQKFQVHPAGLKAQIKHMPKIREFVGGGRMLGSVLELRTSGETPRKQFQIRCCVVACLWHKQSSKQQIMSQYDIIQRYGKFFVDL
ncbi:hypothetical protein G6M50_07630 [Agrobacterium rhizogenes]|nr:hypothetical protein [Rhizobium rhizogenes]NTJ77670.1 hypothetical protein [Rhizobium rhizogenes]